MKANPPNPVIEPTGAASRSVADIAANDFQKAGVFQNRTLTPLVDHIVHVHHRYIRDNAMALMDFAHKVAGHFGKGQPGLQNLESRIHIALESLITYMDREERVLFPAIRQLAAQGNSPEAIDKAPFQFIRQALAQMQLDHCSIREDLLSFRRHARNYDLPEGACNSYSSLFNKLKEFEGDLNRHMHLENDILFPKAIALLDRSSPDSLWHRDR